MVLYIYKQIYKLGGGFNQPLWNKYARQIGSSPQVGANIKKYLKPPPSKTADMSQLY